jgi:hypothetical protein
VKNLIALVVVAFLTFKAYQVFATHQREKLVGVWAIERTIKGVPCRSTLNLKPEGDASMELGANYQGRALSKETFGKWSVRNSRLVIVFDHGEIPIYQNGKEWGGPIQDLGEKSLTIKDDDGKTETWQRVR